MPNKRPPSLARLLIFRFLLPPSPPPRPHTHPSLFGRRTYYFQFSTSLKINIFANFAFLYPFFLIQHRLYLIFFLYNV